MSKVINVDGHAYSVEVGAALNKQEALLRTFGIELLILTPLVLFAAVLAGHSMSRKALEPVMLIALEARRISDRNLELRLPVSPTQDEISHLSITLNNMLARIDAGYRSVKDFTANASHELRTPLARIRTEAEVALLTPRSTLEYQEALANMQGSAEEMTRLTENLLALARADAESSTLTLEPVDLWELIEAECVEWNGVCQHLHRSLRTECVGTEPNAATSASVVLGDRASLMRLTRILLDNAVKFTPAGGSIVVAVEVAGDVAILSVEDSGIGIAPEEQPRIFERFYRVRGDRAEGNSGSGLGLSLAAWIAEQHGSCISLKSAVGCGSRFSLALRRVAHGTAPQDTGRRVGTSLVAEVSVPRR
jgi:signal transduction histidine kinase